VGGRDTPGHDGKGVFGVISAYPDGHGDTPGHDEAAFDERSSIANGFSPPGPCSMTPPAFILRDATPSDIPHVLRLVRGLAEYERKLHEVTATEADIEKLMFGTPRHAHAILAEIPGNRPVGIALFNYTINTFAGRTGLFLEDLFVEADQRGTGIGIALLRRLAARAVAENCNVIEWRVLNWNRPAIDFYSRIGAVPVQDWQVRRLYGTALTALAQGPDNG
jgi:GNAT superfamily N-acetyltransferase